MDVPDAFDGVPAKWVGHPEHGITVEHKPHGLLSRVAVHGVPSQVFVGPNAQRDAQAHAHVLHMDSMIKLLNRRDNDGR